MLRFLVVFMGLSCAACGGPIERPERTDRTTLTRVNGDEIRTLDPHRISVTTDLRVVCDLFQGLTDIDPQAKPIPGQAKSWSVSSDGLTWTFELREGLTWSDEVPITAEDFVYSLRRLADPQTASVYSSLLGPIKGAAAVFAGTAPPSTLAVAALSPLTLQITLTAPQPAFPEMMAFSSMVPVPRHTIETHGEQWSRPENIVNNGAFTVESWQRQAKMVLRKNPNFVDAQSVAMDTVIYIPISDQMTAVRRFRAGEVDIVPDFPDPMGPILKEQLGDQVRIAVLQAAYYYVFNTQVPPFDNKAVRQALSMAVDRQPLVDSVMRSGYKAAFSIVPPNTGFYGDAHMPDWATWPRAQRLERARQLLAAAGISPDTPLDIELRINTSVTHQRLGLAIAQMWKPLGVNVSLFNTEAAVHFAEMRKGNFAVSRAGWVADYNAAENFLFIWQSGNEGLNYAKYNSPAYDALFETAQREADIEKRMAMMRQAETMLIDDSPILPIYFYVSKALVASDIEGWADNLPNRHRSRWLKFKS